MMVSKKLLKLTIKQKSEILDKLKRGISTKILCNDYKVHKSTITRIKKQEAAILKYTKSIEAEPEKRQTLKSCGYPKLENALYKWLMKQKHQNIPISVDMIKSKARKLHEKIREKEGPFNASNGWIFNFKRRYGLRYLKICKERVPKKPAFEEPVIMQLELSPESFKVEETVVDQEMDNVAVKIENMDDSEGDVIPPSKIKASDAVESFDTCIRWAEENGIAIKDILVLKEFRESAFVKSTSEINYSQMQ